MTLASQERRDHLAHRDLQELQAHLDSQELQEHVVLQDLQACQVPGEALAHRVSRVKVGNQELMGRMENVALLDPKVSLGWLVLLVNLEETETLDQMVCQAEMELLVARAIVVKMAPLGPLVLLDIQAPLVLWVHLERVVIGEKRALLVLLGLLVPLVPEVLLVLLALVVTKVKQVNVVPMASKDIEDSLATQAPQALQVLLAIRVPLVVQDLLAPEDLLDPVALLGKMEQVDTQVPLDHQDLEATEVKEVLRALQATQDNQVLLDPLVRQVLAVVVVLLSKHLVVKRLVVLPHIMEMNQWI